MNKLSIGAVVAAIAISGFTAQAEGYQVNSLSAKQNGMGHTGTALKLGAESMFFNPAGMAFMDKQVEVSGSITGIFSSVSADVAGAGKYDTDSDPSTPMNLMVGFRVYDNLKVGVGFYTPYGSNINWGTNWPGAQLNQSVKLAVMTVQPTVSWRVLPNLAVGGGVTVSWGSVDLNKALIMGSSVNMALQAAGYPAMFGDNALASVNLKGDARPRVGFNLGVMWDINEKWTVGFNFRSRVDMKVKAGTARLSYAPEFEQLAALAAANPQFAAIGLLNQIDKANFSAQMPCAAVYRVGVAYKPIEKLTLALDAQLTGWKAYKALDFKFAGSPANQFNQHIEKKYRNSWLFGLGAQYALTERFDVRAGVILDTTPCNKRYYNPETPGMTKIEPSVGVSFRPIKQMSIDASMLYVQGLGADNRTCVYNDLVIGANKFKADYKLHAFCPAIGVTVDF